jgi:hypothetical protein
MRTKVTGRFLFAYHIRKVQLKPKDVYFVVLHFCQQSECAVVTLYRTMEKSNRTSNPVAQCFTILTY